MFACFFTRMKKVYTLFFSLCLLFFTPVHAQKIKGALIGGFNLTQVDGDEIYGYNKPGLNLGASAIIPFNDFLQLSLENIYNQKGSYQGPQYSLDSLTGEYRLNLDYLEVPVLIHYNDKDKLIFGLGVSWGRLVNVKEWEHGRRVESTGLNTGTYKRDDWNVLVDFRFRAYKRFWADFRYAYSMAKIRSREFVFLPPATGSEFRDQFNNVLTFRVIYIFNEQPPVKAGTDVNKGF